MWRKNLRFIRKKKPKLSRNAMGLIGSLNHKLIKRVRRDKNIYPF